MKILVVMVFVAFLFVINVGYYMDHGEFKSSPVFFVKHSPTLKVKFFNIHANEGNHRFVEALTEEQRQKIIDYCKYRLGIETEMKTQADVTMCSKR